VRERERQREKEKEREREIEKEKTNLQAIIFLNCLGKSEKSVSYTVLYCTGKRGIVLVNNP
jgi:hypothetical protein